jgi:hypothetical protein
VEIRFLRDTCDNRLMDDLRFPIGKFTRPGAITPAQRHELVAEIEETPTIVRDAHLHLTAAQLQSTYREGGWTLAQVVHHLPDSHMQAYSRTRLALTEDAPVIKPYREELWAELHDAISSDIESSLLILDGLHRRWVNLLRRLTPEQWSAVYVHPERGRQSLDVCSPCTHGMAGITSLTSPACASGWGGEALTPSPPPGVRRRMPVPLR